MRTIILHKCGLFILAAVTLLATSCSNPKVVKGISDETCITDQEFFNRKIYGPIILNKGCHGCHGENGVAKSSGVDWALNADDATADMKVLQQVALNEINGESALVIKPDSPSSGAAITHKGGDLFTDKDQAFLDDLKEFVNRSKNPSNCKKQAVNYDLLYGVKEYDYAHTLRRARIALTGKIPSATEETLVIEQGRAGLITALDAMMSEDEFYERLIEILNDQYKTDAFVYDPNLRRWQHAYRQLDEDLFPDRAWFESFPADAYDVSVTSTDGTIANCDTRTNTPALACLRRTLRDLTNLSLAREPLQLAVHLVKNDLPFSQILTADYMMVNAFSARAYGLGQDGVTVFENNDKLEDHNYDDFVPVQMYQYEVTREGNTRVINKTSRIAIPHAGMISSPMWMARYPTSTGNVNRHRSRMYFEYFLDTDILTLAQQLDAFGDDEVNPTLTNPNCAVCHSIMDPVAGLFKNYRRDNYYAFDSWYHDSDFRYTNDSTYMRAPGFSEEEPLPVDQNRSSLQWLGQKTTEDKRFALSIVKMMFKALTGNSAMNRPSDVDRSPGLSDEDWEAQYTALVQAYNLQRADLFEFRDSFIASNYNLKKLIKDMVLSPWFRAYNARSSVSDDIRLRDVGINRLLTPEQLNRKLESVTGERWVLSWNNVPYLLSRYAFLYGGIDSRDITTRVTEPSGVMTNIQMRMAIAVACSAVTEDFTYLEHSRRKLLPMVEPSYAPEIDGTTNPEAVAKIKRNIQYLHKRILGEYLPLDDAEIDRTYQLFYLTIKEGIDDDWNNNPTDDNRLECANDPTGSDGFMPHGRRKVNEDPYYTIRAWQAVVAYLMSDYRFLYE